MTAGAEQSSIPLPLFAFSLLYGGMTCIAGVLGSKQVALGPLAVEAGIFPFLLLVALSSSVAKIYDRQTANRLVRFGFIPLVTAIVLTFAVIHLPTDEDMYEPAKEAFPIILGQSWRLMVAGLKIGMVEAEELCARPVEMKGYEGHLLVELVEGIEPQASPIRPNPSARAHLEHCKVELGDLRVAVGSHAPRGGGS